MTRETLKLLQTRVNIMRPGVITIEALACEFHVRRPTDRDHFDYRTEDIKAGAPGPGLGAIKAVVMPLLDPGAELEHVTVLWNDKRADMFVDEEGRLPHRNLPRNDVATRVYRENAMLQDPTKDPESLPYIAGVAVVFDHRIWF